MKFASTKKPSQARLFNLFNPSPEPPASIGACDFMKLLDDLHKRYVTSLQQEFDLYFTIGRMNRAYFGLEEEDPNPYTFADGVRVKSMNYLKQVITLRNRWLAVVGILLVQKTKRVRVEVEDFRFTPGLTGSKVARRFSQELEVPHEFYKFLAKRCMVVGCNYSLDMLMGNLTKELAKTSQELCVFDRPAKLRALRDMLAA